MAPLRFLGSWSEGGTVHPDGTIEHEDLDPDEPVIEDLTGTPVLVVGKYGAVRRLGEDGSLHDVRDYVPKEF